MMTRRSLIPMLTGAFFLQSPKGRKTLSSAWYPFEKLPLRTSNHAQFRTVLRGNTPTGEGVEVHETTLPPNGTPHAPHRHEHSEMWLVRKGTVEITVNGTTHRLGAGSAAFAASNDLHGIKNVGSVPATYFVVAVGPTA